MMGNLFGNEDGMSRALKSHDFDPKLSKLLE